MRFSVGRTEIRVTMPAVLVLAFCIAAGETKPLLLALVSLAVHEAAHAVAARNLKLPIACLTLYPFGAVMRLDALFLSGRDERIVAAAGPLGSLAFAAVLTLFRPLLSEDRIDPLIAANLAIAILNLFPAYPLDGGRIARSALQSVLRERTAKGLLLSFTAAVSVGLTAAGIYLAVRGIPAWALFAIPPFVLFSALWEWKTPDAGTVSRVMERREAIRFGEARKAQIVVIGEDASIRDALASFSGARCTILRVVRSSGFVELTEFELVDAAAKLGVHTPLKTVILRLTDGK